MPDIAVHLSKTANSYSLSNPTTAAGEGWCGSAAPNGLTDEGEVRYKAWGEDRLSTGTTPTSYRYTGQRSEMGSIGLYFYGARFYDPYLNRWIQPDSIVPEKIQGVQAWDRYAAMANNPL
jgi:RHS repeat-associated protein